MSAQLQYVQSYRDIVRAYLASHPEDDAMAWSVGGSLPSYTKWGVLEHSLLRMHGLQDDSSVLDVGCGAGRLARQLADFPHLRYSGIDIVPELLNYARKKLDRPDFQLALASGNEIPAANNSFNFIAFFSVFTHLLHEESYNYLEQSHRILIPGGRVIFSFLEFSAQSHWQVFDGNVEWVRKRFMGHINVFMNRSDLELWARRLKFEIISIRSGDDPTVMVTDKTATNDVPVGNYAFGQSYCVLEKSANP